MTYPIDQHRIDKDYTYHAPKEDQPERYQVIRKIARELAITIMENCPPSREQALALTHLDAAVMCANSAIARNE